MTDVSHASSPPGPTMGQELNYYKAQYEHLAVELRDFQETSRELEAELEREAEAAEQREKKYKAKIEALGHEVDELKVKHKSAKTESLATQSALQREITALRDAHRTTQLKLRDMEVINDDYERQTRNTTSSLDDMVGKYETALERNVMLEEEVKIVEHERENLRIETQRLRDELSDLKVETDILQNKLRSAEVVMMKNANMDTVLAITSSTAVHETSNIEHMVEAAGPPTASISLMGDLENLSSTSATNSPPSPPMSENSGTVQTVTSVPSATKSDSSSRHAQYRFADADAEPPKRYSIRNTTTPHFARPTHPRAARSSVGTGQDLVRSGSLYQFRGLVQRMQQLEEKVQQVKSKIPAQEASLKQGTSPGSGTVPETITVRRSTRRPSELLAAQRLGSVESANQPRRLSHRPSRLSMGIKPTPAGNALEPTLGGLNDQTTAPVIRHDPGVTPKPVPRPRSRLSNVNSLKPNEPSAHSDTTSDRRAHGMTNRHMTRERTGPTQVVSTSVMSPPARSERRVSSRFAATARSTINTACDPP